MREALLNPDRLARLGSLEDPLHSYRSGANCLKIIRGELLGGALGVSEHSERGLSVRLRV